MTAYIKVLGLATQAGNPEADGAMTKAIGAVAPELPSWVTQDISDTTLDVSGIKLDISCINEDVAWFEMWESYYEATIAQVEWGRVVGVDKFMEHLKSCRISKRGDTGRMRSGGA